MKTAVSIPDDVFRAADRLAKRLKRSRSALYADALRAYLERRDADSITDAINRHIDAHGQPTDPGVIAQGIEILRKVDW